MILRPRQKVFVERSLSALDEHGNTLGVASVGFGKTIALSAVVGGYCKTKQLRACVIAHRDELTSQNQRKFKRVIPDISTSVFDAREKSWEGQVTFAMVQTLSRTAHLVNMPAIDLLVIDEAHHAVAASYRQLIDHIKQRNPQAAIYGVTATPGRGDGRGLRPVFSNIADQVQMSEIIRDGHLVPPRTFVVDVGTRDALLKVNRTVDDFDMVAVANIMDKQVINEEVVKHWKEQAGNRKTVVFCSTVQHAAHVSQCFTENGVKSAVIHGELSRSERREYINEFDRGDLQVLVNCFVLTEGFDSQPVSCVVLLRPSSHKSTYIQMIGRGLRTVDPEEYPGVTKTDCIVLDFGTSTLMHGSLEQEAKLDGHQGSGQAPTKTCPDCDAEVPLSSMECALCGHVWERTTDGEKTELTEFVMSEVDLLKRSSFRWSDLFGDDTALMATGFSAWAGVFYLNGQWFAVGGGKGLGTHLLSIGARTLGIAAADDWLNEYESEEAARKSRNWLSQSVTQQQLKYLPTEYQRDFGLTRYQASCLITFRFNKRAIQTRIFESARAQEAA
jgi:superfamily II DNA or RNA helicase